MALVSLQGVNVSFGGPLLLNGVDLSIDRGERVCCVGRNGTGKSTIMRLMTEEVRPDGGTIVFQQNVRIALLAQEVPRNSSAACSTLCQAPLASKGNCLPNIIT